MPALTCHRRGAGTGWYLATQLDPDSVSRLLEVLLDEARITCETPFTGKAAGWVETVHRGELQFVINHGSSPITLTVPGTDILTGASAAGLVLAPQDVAVIT